MRLHWVSQIAAALMTVAVAQAQATPDALQASGIARIEAIRTQYRQSGFQPNLLLGLSAAAGDLETSYRRFLAAGNPSAAATSLAHLGTAERLTFIFLLASGQSGQRLENYVRSARGHYEEAAALARRTNNAATLVKALSGLAMLDQTYDHDYGAANTRIQEALRAAPSCRNRDCMLDALLSKAEVETYRGELFAAASHLNAVFSLLKQDPDNNRLYSAYLDRSDVYRSMTEGCSYNQQKAVDLCYQLFDLAKADMTMARSIAARAGYADDANRASEEISQLDMLRGLTEQYNGVATRALATGYFQPKTPRDVLVSEVIPLGQLPPNQVEELKKLRDAAGPAAPGALQAWCQAELDDLAGRTDAALAGYLRAIRTVEEDRRRLGEDSARSSFLDGKISLFERPILMLFNARRYDEMFDLMERSHARATADLLSTRSAALSKSVDRQTFAALARKKAEISSIQAKFFTGSLQAESQINDAPDTVIQSQAHLAGLEAEYEQMLLRLGRQAPAVRDAAVSQPVSLAALQSALRRDRMDLLYYYVIDNSVILFHVGADAVHARSIFLPRLGLIRKVTALRASISKRDDAEFHENAAQELFLYLIQPALGWLSSDRVVIVPPAELQSLPFQVFRDPVDGSFLGERLQITYAPSASILLQLTRQANLAGGSVLAAADPALPGSVEEVSVLSRVYLNQSRIVSNALIRKTDLQQWAGSYGILHLAVHGLFDSMEPLLSYVSVAGDGGEDRLTAAEMLGLPLERARLVTLSACESGRVRATRSNDIQGIQQALLIAGAQSLLVSAWRVDSDATSLWMQSFYREAQTKTPAEAARAAIRTMRRDPQHRHPFYWAPFLLIAR